MFRPFWVGFPYFSLPFGVTAPRRKQVAELNCRSKISHQKRKPAQSTCIGTWMSQEVSKRLESGLYFQYTQFISSYNYRLLPIDPNHFILTSNIPSNGTCWQDSARATQPPKPEAPVHRCGKFSLLRSDQKNRLPTTGLGPKALRLEALDATNRKICLLGCPWKLVTS